MRAGPLANPAILKLLKPFVVTTWHGAGEPTMPADVKEVFSSSELSRDSKRSNVFMFVLSDQGQLVHSFNGLSGRGEGRSDYVAEINKARATGKLPADRPAPRPTLAIPDLTKTESGLPAGMRLFIRRADDKGVPSNQPAVVELVPMKPEDWNALAYPEKPREIEAEILKSWLVQLYPPAIRTVDQRKPFTKITGVLKLEPAGADGTARQAVLHGKVQLAKGDETQSAYEGTFQAVLTYAPNAPQVRSVRGIIDGEYLYRQRGTQRMALVAAFESRPE